MENQKRLKPMENQKHLKMRISRMFHSSFGSCRTRNLTDVMEKAVFAPPSSTHSSFHLTEPLLSPKTAPFPSIRKPNTVDDASFNHSLPRRAKISSPFLPSGNPNAVPCPPSSPDLSLNPLRPNDVVFGDRKTKASHRSAKTKNHISNDDKKKKKQQQQKKKRHAHKRRDIFPFNSCAKDTNFDGYWWYSGDEDDETDTLFSSKSHSSDSSRSRRRRRKSNRRSEMGVMPLQGKVKDTFAVVKRSRDPYSDFRTSMVEMIVEKQIFTPNELENLLHCFLSLNSHHHHNIILQVFTEIWEALFSDWF